MIKDNRRKPRTAIFIDERTLFDIAIAALDA
jgi:hypothetical protein